MENDEGRTNGMSISKHLLAWFEAHKRPLPWRENYTPYAVWISEVMLQQTQMHRGVAYFLRWMERFPDIASLAAAKEEDVLRAWEGLGYYSRARNILKTARILCERHAGQIPQSAEIIRSLPGIGEYTTNAILSIAFQKDVVCIDANVERCLARLFDIADDVRSSKGRDHVRMLASSLLPLGHARSFNQALMEFGALVCTKKPACAVCPLSSFCLGLARRVIASRPVKQQYGRTKRKRVALALLQDDTRMLVAVRRQKGLWEGLYTFPFCTVKGDPLETLCSFLTQLLGITLAPPSWQTVCTHAYTTWQIELFAFGLTPARAVKKSLPEGYRWVSLEQLHALPFPSPHRKIFAEYLEQQKSRNAF